MRDIRKERSIKRFLVLFFIITSFLLPHPLFFAQARVQDNGVSLYADSLATKPLQYKDGPNQPKPPGIPKAPPDRAFDYVKIVKEIEGNFFQYVSGGIVGDVTNIQVGGKGDSKRSPN